MSTESMVTQADLLKQIARDKAAWDALSPAIRKSHENELAAMWPQRLTELVADLEAWEPHMIEALRATEPAKKLAAALTTPAPAVSTEALKPLGDSE